LEIRDEIACQIMAYLAEHPEAQDTLDGIIHWWLLERNIIHQSSKVKKALKELSEKGLILEYNNRSLQTLYRVNRDKIEEINRIFQKPSDS
jgi:hypothetical protein